MILGLQKIVHLFATLHVNFLPYFKLFINQVTINKDNKQNTTQ